MMTTKPSTWSWSWFSPQNSRHQTSVSKRWFEGTQEPSTCKGRACYFGSSIGEPGWIDDYEDGDDHNFYNNYIYWLTWSGGWVLLVGVFGAIIVTANPKSAICGCRSWSWLKNPHWHWIEWWWQCPWFGRHAKKSKNEHTKKSSRSSGNSREQEFLQDSVCNIHKDVSKVRMSFSLGRGVCFTQSGNGKLSETIGWTRPPTLRR